MNGTPTVGDFVAFLREMEPLQVGFGLEGFAFDPSYRYGDQVSLEGIGYRGSYSAEVGFAFARFVAPFKPDELCLEPGLLRAWWD